MAAVQLRQAGIPSHWAMPSRTRSGLWDGWYAAVKSAYCLLGTSEASMHSTSWVLVKKKRDNLLEVLENIEFLTGKQCDYL